MSEIDFLQQLPSCLKYILRGVQCGKDEGINVFAADGLTPVTLLVLISTCFLNCVYRLYSIYHINSKPCTIETWCLLQLYLTPDKYLIQTQ